MKKRYTVKRARRRTGKTDYRARFRLLRSEKPRLVLRKSLNHTSAQLVRYDAVGDRVLASAHSFELRKLGWRWSCGNIAAAYLTGLLLGRRALSKGYHEAIADLGLCNLTKAGRLAACLKGATEAGLKLSVAPEQGATFRSSHRCLVKACKTTGLFKMRRSGGNGQGNREIEGKDKPWLSKSCRRISRKKL